MPRLPFLTLGLSLWLAAAVLPVAADDAPPRRIAGPVEARVIEVRDGDTVEVAAFVWPDQTVHVAVRLRGIDAPEMRARCPREAAAAQAAQERLSALVGQGPVVLRDVAGDKYFGRVLADLSARGGGESFAATLLREGLVAPYSGRGPRHDWCALTIGAAPGADGAS